MAFSHRPTEHHFKEHDLEFFQMAKSEFDLTVKHILTTADYGCDVDGDVPIEIHLFQLTR